MITRYLKIVPIALLALSLVLVGWTAFPSAPPPPAPYTPPIPGAQAILTRLSAFTVDPGAVTPANISGFDRTFLENAILMNTAEMTMMQDAMTRTKNAEVKGLTQLMMQMHAKDAQQLALLRAQFATGPLPGIEAAPVLPGTALAIWGVTTVNLKTLFVDKVTKTRGPFEVTYLNAMIDLHSMGVEGAVVGVNNTQNLQIKAVAEHLQEELNIHKWLMIELRDRVYFHLTTPIDLTGAVSPSPSPMPTSTVTAAPPLKPTNTATATPMRTPTITATATPTQRPTNTATATPTSMPTQTATATPTLVPTMVGTASPTFMPTTGGTAAPTFTPTATETISPTVMPTAAATVAPTFAPTTTQVITLLPTPTVH